MSAFTPRKFKPVIKDTGNQDIISRELQDRVKITGDKPVDFVSYKVLVETKRINRQQYIDSFKDDVGIENIAKKFALTNDPNVFNQRGLEFKDGEITDLTNLPKDYVTGQNMVDAAKAKLNDVPQELADLILHGSREDILAYYEKQNVKSEVKEGE